MTISELSGRELDAAEWIPKRPNTPCLVWGGPKDEKGYGLYFTPNGRHLMAHRIEWERTNGPIPDSLVIDHLCRNHGCVNPDHLEVVTHRVNVLRGVGVTAINANKNRCKRGHEFDSENTIIRRDKRGTWRSCRKCIKDNERKRRDPKTRFGECPTCGHIIRE